MLRVNDFYIIWVVVAFSLLNAAVEPYIVDFTAGLQIALTA